MISQLDKLKYITHFVLWKHSVGIEHECFHLISMYNYPEKWDACNINVQLSGCPILEICQICCSEFLGSLTHHFFRIQVNLSISPLLLDMDFTK